MIRDRHKNPLLAWRPPGELSGWARSEARRREQGIGEFLTSLLAAERKRAADDDPGPRPVPGDRIS
jgi:hypothetical protein